MVTININITITMKTTTMWTITISITITIGTLRLFLLIFDLGSPSPHLLCPYRFIPSTSFFQLSTYTLLFSLT